MRRRTTRAVTVDAFDLQEMLCFLASWFPPEHGDSHERSRWSSWEEFLRDYRAVREELLEQTNRTPTPCFAERVRRFVDRRGLRALDGLECLESVKQALDEFDADTDEDGGELVEA